MGFFPKQAGLALERRQLNMGRRGKGGFFGGFGLILFLILILLFFDP